MTPTPEPSPNAKRSSIVLPSEPGTSVLELLRSMSIDEDEMAAEVSTPKKEPGNFKFGKSNANQKQTKEVASTNNGETINEIPQPSETKRPLRNMWAKKMTSGDSFDSSSKLENNSKSQEIPNKTEDPESSNKLKSISGAETVQKKQNCSVIITEPAGSTKSAIENNMPKSVVPAIIETAQVPSVIDKPNKIDPTNIKMIKTIEGSLPTNSSVQNQFAVGDKIVLPPPAPPSTSVVKEVAPIVGKNADTAIDYTMLPKSIGIKKIAPTVPTESVIVIQPGLPPVTTGDIPSTKASTQTKLNEDSPIIASTTKSSGSEENKSIDDKDYKSLKRQTSKGWL